MENIFERKVAIKAANKEVIVKAMAEKAAKECKKSTPSLRYLDRETELLKLVNNEKIAHALEVVADELKLTNPEIVQVLVNAMKKKPWLFAQESEEIALLVDDLLEDASLRAASALRRKQELKALESAIRILCSKKNNALYNAEVVRAMAESRETAKQLRSDIIECFHNFKGDTLKAAFYEDEEQFLPDDVEVKEDNYCIVPQDGEDAEIGDYSWLQDKLRKQINKCNPYALKEKAAIQSEINEISKFILAHPELCEQTEKSKQLAALKKAEQAQQNFNPEELAKAIAELEALQIVPDDKYKKLEELTIEFEIDI